MKTKPRPITYTIITIKHEEGLSDAIGAFMEVDEEDYWNMNFDKEKKKKKQ